MGKQVWQTWALLGLAVCTACVSATAANASYYPFPTDASKKQAYVTLCYGEEFMLGVRVLGQSLKESGTDRSVLPPLTCAHPGNSACGRSTRCMP